MKKAILSIASLFGIAAFAPLASASLLYPNEYVLVGWHDFSESLASGTRPNPDFIESGFSGTISYSGTGGSQSSTDGFYGPDSTIDGGFATGAGATVDGRIANANGTLITLTNNTGDDYVLGSLLFDGALNGNPVNYGITYQIGSDPEVTIPSIPSVPGGTSYLDFIVNLYKILPAGESIGILFNTTFAGNDGRLDNIALTAIPEPAGVLVLTLLIGGGLMTRSRRIAVTPTLG